MGKASAKTDGGTSNYGSQTGPNQQTQDYLNQIQAPAKQAGTAGPSPLVGGAAGYGTSQQTAGQTGLNALSGDPNAVSQLMNPYMKQVVDATQASYAKTGTQAVNSVDANATSMGAFGGSRNGVAQGVASANNTLNDNRQIAGLLGSGYSQAMGQASTLAQNGAQGAYNNANLGLQGVGSPSQWNMNMLKQ